MDRKVKSIGIIVISILFIGLYIYLQPKSKETIMLLDSVIRIGIGLILGMILFTKGYDLFQWNDKSLKATMLLILPAMIIAINNFPISSLINGRITFEGTTLQTSIFAFEMLAVAFVEEVVFRGVIILLLMQIIKKPEYKVLKVIVYSSLIFGSIHLLNELEMISSIDILLQVGYTTLVGAMWATIYLKTNNLYYPILLHALYNFFGQVMFEFGQVNQRYDTITILTTTLVSMIALIYYIKVYQTLEYKKEK